MLKAREAGFRWLRGVGWGMALPTAVAAGVIIGLITGDPTAGMVMGAGVSMFGLFILSFGYVMGDLWSGYWVIPVTLIGGNVALIFYAGKGHWLVVLAITGVVIVMSALVSAINHTARGKSGLLRVFTNFFRSLTPGKYPL